MSSYINFYLKHDNKFCQLWSFSRSCVEYQHFNDILPYGKNVPITFDILNIALDNVNKDIQIYKKHIKENKKDIEIIAKMEGVSFHERMENISEYRTYISEEKDHLFELKRCKHFIEFLEDLLYNVKWSDIDSNDYLYAGIEAINPNEKEE